MKRAGFTPFKPLIKIKVIVWFRIIDICRHKGIDSAQPNRASGVYDPVEFPRRTGGVCNATLNPLSLIRVSDGFAMQ